MGVLLEITAGPMAGKVIGLKTGEAVTFGRAAGRAEFALPHDTFMSGVHFAVECGASGCRVQDRKSSNGTFLNGARISDAMLANGDEIKGGQTIFKVKIVADGKLASLVPPQAAAPQAIPSPRPRAPEPVPQSPPDLRPRGAEPAAPPRAQQPFPPVGEQQPRATPEPRPRAAEPAQSPVQPAPPSARPPHVETPSVRIISEFRPAAGSSAEIEDVREPRITRDAGVEPPPRKLSPSEPPASGDPPGDGADVRRPSQPPPGVASHIARKFGDGPLERGDGSKPQGPAFSVMGWSFPAAPAEWQVQEGFGLQRSGHEEFPSSVAATEELLGGITLQQFVESQISTLRGYLRDARIEPTMPPRVGGADESMAMDIHHSTKDGRELIYRRIYARSGSSVGVLTVTTLASDLPQVLQSLQPLLDGAAFRATANH